MALLPLLGRLAQPSKKQKATGPPSLRGTVDITDVLTAGMQVDKGMVGDPVEKAAVEATGTCQCQGCFWLGRACVIG